MHRRSAPPLLLLTTLLLGCAALRPVPPPPPPEPQERVALSALLDLRGEVLRAFPAETEEAALGRAFAPALVDALRRHGHRPATWRLDPEPQTWAAALPDRLPRTLLPPDCDAALLQVVRRTELQPAPVGEERVLDLELAAYRCRDGARVWQRREVFRRSYPSPPDPADLAEDLAAALLQRVDAGPDSELPRPLLADFPPARPAPPAPAQP